ncbi:hypothetical protein BRADI_3g17796v3 [Brachypodium distachyon]|uniref:Uncharacterized protein n=1 Tax=Brachypodium distachyon TaxID=15368 RepID=A0A0Q3I4M1_BRADI|nr:hypothetical protein BRADI_3g17796v3 [Brachypodium distachyon]
MEDFRLHCRRCTPPQGRSLVPWARSRKDRVRRQAAMEMSCAGREVTDRGGGTEMETVPYKGERGHTVAGVGAATAGVGATETVGVVDGVGVAGAEGAGAGAAGAEGAGAEVAGAGAAGGGGGVEAARRGACGTRGFPLLVVRCDPPAPDLSFCDMAAAGKGGGGGIGQGFA